MDGEWEAPLIPNPACAEAAGCGLWKPPMVPNPAYKGKWRAPVIDNPNYQVDSHRNMLHAVDRAAHHSGQVV